MTGLRTLFRKITRSRSPNPRTATPPREPVPPKDDPPPDPQDRRAPSQSLHPDQNTRASLPSPRPSSSPSSEDISIPVPHVPAQESSPAHPVLSLPETQRDPRTSETPSVDPSESTTHVSPSWSKLRSTVDIALRLGQSGSEVFPPAKAAIAGVIEILKIVDVSCIVFHFSADKSTTFLNRTRQTARRRRVRR